MGQVYDPVLKRLISDVEADALNAQRREHAQPAAMSVDLDGEDDAFVGPREQSFFGLRNPGNDRSQDVGVETPPMVEDDVYNIIEMFPQLAGLAAQFVPGGKLASVAAPTAMALITQMLSDDQDFNPLDAALEGVQGFGANRVGAAVRAVGTGGEEWVKRALRLKGANKTDEAIETLPELAIREGQPMTQAGAEAVRASGTRVLPNGVKITSKNHKRLAEAMDSSRLDDETAPSRLTLWPQEAIANYFRRGPRQFAIGQKMANPIGNVRTAKHIAPAVEAMMRLKLIEMAGQEEPPLASSRGPARRPLK